MHGADRVSIHKKRRNAAALSSSSLIPQHSHPTPLVRPTCDFLVLESLEKGEKAPFPLPSSFFLRVCLSTFASFLLRWPLCLCRSAACWQDWREKRRRGAPFLKEGKGGGGAGEEKKTRLPTDRPSERATVFVDTV